MAAQVQKYSMIMTLEIFSVMDVRDMIKVREQNALIRPCAAAQGGPNDAFFVGEPRRTACHMRGQRIC